VPLELLVGVVQVEGVALVLGQQDPLEAGLDDGGEQPVDRDLRIRQVLGHVVELRVEVLRAVQQRPEALDVRGPEGQEPVELADGHLLGEAAAHRRDLRLHPGLVQPVVPVRNHVLEQLGLGPVGEVPVEGGLRGALDEAAEVRHQAQVGAVELVHHGEHLLDLLVARLRRRVHLDADLDPVALGHGRRLLHQVRRDRAGAQVGDAQVAGGHQVRGDVEHHLGVGGVAAGDLARVDVPAVGERGDAVLLGGAQDRVDLGGLRARVLVEDHRPDQLELLHAERGELGEHVLDPVLRQVDQPLLEAVQRDGLLDGPDLHFSSSVCSTSVRAAEPSIIP
jgi:hypothetical protein